MVSAGSNKSRGETAPWAAQQPYLRQIYEQAQSLFTGGPYEYGPNRVAGFSDPSQRAFQMIEGGNLGAEGQALRQAAAAENQRTLAGDYLSPSSNPYLQGTYDDAAEAMRRNYFGSLNQLGSRAAMAGRAGGDALPVTDSMAQENFARGLGQLGNELFGGAYERERGRMGQAQQTAGYLAQGLSDEAYRGANALRTVGQEREAMAQRVLDDLVERFNYEQRGGELEDRLARYSGLIGSPVMTQRQRSSGWNFGVSMG